MQVDNSDADGFIKKAIKEGKLVRGLRIVQKDGKVFIPVTERVEFRGAVPCFTNFQSRYKSSISRVISENIHSGEEKPKWQRIGEAIIFSRNYGGLETIARNLVESGMVKQVYVNQGKIDGKIRKPTLLLVAGEAGDTIYRENGVIFLTNPANLMMSKGNIVERGLPSMGDFCPERVLDMFSGIGYFSLPLARLNSVKVVQCLDINGEALDYLSKSARINGFQEKIRCKNLDCRLFKSKEKFDLVIMGNFKSKDYLSSALGHVSENGRIILHHLELSENRYESIMQIMKTGRMLGFNLIPMDSHVVKSYSPHVWHMSSLFRVTWH